jgi:hypothetical protein
MPEPREVKLGHDRVFLLLSDEHAGESTRSSAGELWSMHAHLHLPHLRADAQVHLGPAAVETSLASFFDELAAEWRGWEVSKTWRAYEGGLELACANDGRGHMTLTVRLDARTSTYPWVVRAEIPIDAGQLDGLADDLRRFETP